MKKVHLVAHTHWDREWYKPFQYFRTKLVYMIDDLLLMLDEMPDFSSFMLDGQTVVLEDYLRIKPENEIRLKEYIASGRITVGPWYIQPDEFAPDAESLVRNLLTGLNQAEKYGRPMMVGYLPDSFGHSSQMPQILRGFGIESAVVMRGVDFDQIGATEFNWKGLNGDSLLGIYLRKGYMNAMFLSENNTINKMRLKALVKELGSITSAEHVLVMNGVDHAFAQRQAASLCRENPGWMQGSLEDYIKLVRKEVSGLQTLEGELVTPRHHRVHTSIASTRMGQKAENRRRSIEIERQLEPLCVITSLHGAEYPAGLIDEAWKTLMKNQTHDGICGCCTDEVHREMDRRFAEVRQISEALIKGHSRAFASLIGGDGPGLIVFNTAMTAGIQYIEAEFTGDDGFLLLDEEGLEIDIQIISSEEIDVSEASIWTLYLGTPQPAKKIRFIIKCSFEAVLGWRFFRIKPAVSKPTGQNRTEAAVEENSGFENEFYRMEIIPDGSLSVYDKESGFSYEGLNTLEDIGEGGDSYNHCPLEEDVPILSRGAEAIVEKVEDGLLMTVFRIEQSLLVPESLSLDGRNRSLTEVPLTIVTLVRVYPESRRIEFELEIDNRALSHRLRVLFPFGETVEDSSAETQFGVIRRKTSAPSGGDDWPEKPLPIYSMQRFAGLESGSRSLFVLNRGLTEYEVYQREESVLALTLHRGVSMMGRADLSIRPGRPSGISMPTPDAESIGILRREYALITGGTLPLGDVISEADRYCSPALAVQNRINIDKIQRAHKDFFKYLSVGNLRTAIAGSLSKSGQGSRDFIRLGTGRLAVSAVKKALRDDSVILRLYNPGENAVAGEVLTILFPHSTIFITDLFEREQEELRGDVEYLLPSLRPNTQITIKIIREVSEK